MASNENFSDNQTVQNVRESFENGIVAANGITPSQVSAPGIWDAFWKGDTRTSADMLGVEINAARIKQLYGNNEGKFDIGKFNQAVKGETFSKQLEQLTSIVTLAQSGTGIGMEGFISGEQLSEVLSSMIQSDTKNKGADARMQIAQWGAMLATKGFVSADTMKIIADELGIFTINEQVNEGKKPSSLSDFGVNTLEQAQAVSSYAAIIQKAAGDIISTNLGKGVIVETSKIMDNIKSLESRLEGQSFEQQQQIIENERKMYSSQTFVDPVMISCLNDLSSEITAAGARENIKKQIKGNAEKYSRKAVKKALSNVDNLTGSQAVSMANNLDMRILTGMSLAEMGVKFSSNQIQFSSTENNHIPRVEVGGAQYELSLADLIDMGIVKSDNITVVNKGKDNSSYMLEINVNGTNREIVVDAASLPSDFTTSEKYRAVVETIAEQVSTKENINRGSLDYGNILSKFSVAANSAEINPLGISAETRIHSIKEGHFSGKLLQLSYFDAFVMEQGLQNFFNSNSGYGSMEDFFNDLKSAENFDKLSPVSKKIIEKLSTEKFIGMEAQEGIADRIKFLADNLNEINDQISSVQKSVKDFINNMSEKGIKGIDVVNILHECLVMGKTTTLADGTEISIKVSEGQQTDWLMSFMYEYVKASDMWGKGGSFSASQSEAISAFLSGQDIALGMGGGKTPIGTEATIIHRILFGDNARCEILVGNEDLDNFTKGDAKDMFDLFGLQTVQSKQFRNADGSWNIDGLLAAYQEANTVVVMSPTDRGFLKAEAAAKGGETALKINTALNSVTNMVIDEVHKVAQNQVSTVISNGNTSPTLEEITRAMKYAEVLDYKTILDRMSDIKNEQSGRNSENLGAEGAELGTKILIGDEEVSVAMFRTEAEALAYKDKNVVAVIQSGPVAEKIMLLGNANELIKKSVGEDFNASEFESMIKGLFATDAVGGFADTPKGIKPVGTDGPQMNMVPSDYYIQMGVLLKRNMTNMNEIMAAFAQISKTSMSVSNKDITAGVRGIIRGMTGTAEGYEPHIKNITGSERVYSISGENFDYKDNDLDPLDFTGNRDAKQAAIVDKMVNLLGDIEITDSFTEKSDGKGGKVKMVANDEFDNFLFLAKDASTIGIIREALQETVTVTIDGQAQTMKLYDLLSLYGIEVYEFTNRTGKWNSAENATTNLETIQESLSDVAKDYTKRRLIIANEFGMTGIDFQGFFNNF